MSQIARFSFPTAIHFGAGARKLAGEHLASQGLKRPLLVTDRGVAALPLHGELMGLLKEAGLEATSFSGVFGNPVATQVDAGVASYHAHGADSIIGVGGGAALDVAKAIALMVDHPGYLFDYEDEKPGARPIDQDIPYWIALPTTSGTGSEVGRSSVVSDDTTHIKKIIFSPRLLARAVFADPELTLGLPAGVTAATGMDALTHCVEAYLAKGFHPICDGIALEGLRLAAGALTTAVQRPTDVAARSDMMMASMMGAIAFQKGLGVTHSCAHALGTVADMHHGLANGVMIDHALAHNVAACGDRFAKLAQAANLADTSGKAFLEYLSGLKAVTGIPKDLTAAGISRDKLERLIEVAIDDACHQNNPIPCSRDDFRRIFTQAFG